jgi:protein SCO1
MRLGAKTASNLCHRFLRCVLIMIIWVFMLSAPEAQLQSHSNPHAHHHLHHEVEPSSGYKRSIHHYTVPNVMLLNARGERVSLQSQLVADTPLLLNFIFTSCTAICPVLSATFSQMQNTTEFKENPPRMISISVDPEFDTPERLMIYAKQFDAGSQWQFFTGRSADIVQVQRAFSAYRGDKMNHIPLTFLRASTESPWVRLEGFTGVESLLREYRQLGQR